MHGNTKATPRLSIVDCHIRRTDVFKNGSVDCSRIAEKVMEMKNFTIAELYCSVEFTGEVHDELVFLSVINTFLSITPFWGNTLILVALHEKMVNCEICISIIYMHSIFFYQFYFSLR